MDMQTHAAPATVYALNDLFHWPFEIVVNACLKPATDYTSLTSLMSIAEAVFLFRARTEKHTHSHKSQMLLHVLPTAWR